MAHDNNVIQMAAARPRERGSSSPRSVPAFSPDLIGDRLQRVIRMQRRIGGVCIALSVASMLYFVAQLARAVLP